MGIDFRADIVDNFFAEVYDNDPAYQSPGEFGLPEFQLLNIMSTETYDPGIGYQVGDTATLTGGNGPVAGAFIITAIATPYGLVDGGLVTGGSSYVETNVLTVSGGTFDTAAEITIDAVAAGVVVEFHISAPGSYTVIPEGTLSVTGGAGSGFTFTGTWGGAVAEFEMSVRGGYTRVPDIPISTITDQFGSGFTLSATFNSVAGQRLLMLIEVLRSYFLSVENVFEAKTASDLLRKISAAQRFGQSWDPVSSAEKAQFDAVQFIAKHNLPAAFTHPDPPTTIGATIFSTSYDPPWVDLILKKNPLAPALPSSKKAPAGFVSYWYNVTELPPVPGMGGFYFHGIVGAKSTLAGASSNIIFQVFHSFSADCTQMFLGLLLGNTALSKKWGGVSLIPLPVDDQWHNVAISWNAGGGHGTSQPLQVHRTNPPLLSPTGVQPTAFYTLDLPFHGTNPPIEYPFAAPDPFGANTTGGFALDFTNIESWNVGNQQQLGGLGTAFVGAMAELYVYVGDYYLNHHFTPPPEVNTPFVGPWGLYAPNLGDNGIDPLGIVPTLYMTGGPSSFAKNSTGGFGYSTQAGFTAHMTKSVTSPFDNNPNLFP